MFADDAVIYSLGRKQCVKGSGWKLLFGQGVRLTIESSEYWMNLVWIWTYLIVFILGCFGWMCGEFVDSYKNTCNNLLIQNQMVLHYFLFPSWSWMTICRCLSFIVLGRNSVWLKIKFGKCIRLNVETSESPVKDNCLVLLSEMNLYSSDEGPSASDQNETVKIAQKIKNQVR